MFPSSQKSPHKRNRDSQSTDWVTMPAMLRAIGNQKANERDKYEGEEEGNDSSSIVWTAPTKAVLTLRKTPREAAAVRFAEEEEEEHYDEEGSEDEGDTVDEDGREKSPEGTWGEGGSNSCATSTSGNSNSSSSDDDDTDENNPRGVKEDKVRHYPQFTSDYARKCANDLIPFLREEVVPPEPSARHEGALFYSINSSSPPVSPPTAPNRTAYIKHAEDGSSSSSLNKADHNDGNAAAATHDVAPPLPPPHTRLVLYGEYVYLRTLGKGTFSKVVLATRRKDAGAMSLASHTSVNSSDAPLVAMKVFRDENAYREACWDEVCILRTLCKPPEENVVSGGIAPFVAAATTDGMGGVHAGFANHYSNMGRFLAPLEYLPHPQHAAMVLPVMGPSLLQVMRGIKRASREMTHAQPKRVIDVKKNGIDSEGTQVWVRGLPLHLFKAVLHQILTFLVYTHSRGVVHTDLKPENVLFEGTATVPTQVPIVTRTVRMSLAARRGGANASKGHVDPSSTCGDLVDSMKKLHDSYKLSSAEQTLRAAEAKDGVSGSSKGVNEKSHRGGEDEDEGVVTLAHWVTAPLPVLNGIRVVDLGAAQFVSSFKHVCYRDGVTPVCYDPIQTTHYRAPEVLLDLGWSALADIFSLGCMIPELVTGECMFMPNDTLEHLALMQHIIGPFREPEKVTDAVRKMFVCNKRTYEHFFHFETGELKWPATQAIVQAQKAAAKPAGNSSGGLAAKRGEDDNDDDDDGTSSERSELEVFSETSWKDIKFVLEKPTLTHLIGHIPHLEDLTRRMLEYDPLCRITAAEALQHPFFSMM